jgi:hypothetical protein
MLFGMYDSGIFSYLSQRNTVPLNGLISDEQTMLASLHRQYDKILKRFGIDYVVGYLTDDEIRAQPQGAVLFRSSRPYTHFRNRGKHLCIVDIRRYAPSSGSEPLRGFIAQW